MLGVGDCLDIGTTGVAFSEGERNLVARPVPNFRAKKAYPLPRKPTARAAETAISQTIQGISTAGKFR
jgi:hypothetical protein